HPAHMPRLYHVYILASRTRVLYVGVTGHLLHRLHQHRTRASPGFTSRYRATRLVHLEETDDVAAALAREKQIKGWLRKKKIALIETSNPAWDDLAEAWF